MVRKQLRSGDTVKIHTQNGQPGMRQWIRGEQFAVELFRIMDKAIPGEIYHVAGEEVSNLEMAHRVAAEMGMELKYELVEQPKTHEWRYAIR
jgi:dTDP-D-glucose 4,6-dehydratase